MLILANDAEIMLLPFTLNLVKTPQFLKMFYFKNCVESCGKSPGSLPVGSRSHECDNKGRTIRKVMGGGGGMGDFQLAR